VTIFGSPWQPEYHSWAFNMSTESAASSWWSKLPTRGIDLLVTHGPPQAHLSFADKSDFGCPHLLQAVLRLKPTIHAFGHCHESYGTKRANQVLFINASNVSKTRKPINNVIVVDIAPRESKSAK